MNEVGRQNTGKGSCTLADVARDAGMSKSTVSLALRGDTRVSPATRERILKAAATLGYRPHPALSSLSAYRWNKERLHLQNVAYVVGAKREDWTFSEREYFTGASRAAASLGCNLEAFCISDYPSAAAMERVLKTRGISGLLMAPVLHSQNAFSMSWDEYSAVACGLGLDVFPLDTVIPDIYNSLRSAVAHVANAGYRRLGLALMFHNGPSLNDQYRYAAALLEQQLATQHSDAASRYTIDILATGSDDTSGLAQWLGKGKFDAVLGLSDDVEKAIRRNGFRMPEDFGFASLHKSNTDTHIAGIDCDRQAIGEAAMRLLDLELRNNRKGAKPRPSTHMIQSIWISGATLPQRQALIEPVR